MTAPILPPARPSDRPLPAGPGPMLTAHHPSPLVHVPRRGRKPRLGYERIATPVRLLTAGDADFALAPRHGEADLLADFHQEEAFAYAGALFTPLRDHDGEVAPTDFLAHLARSVPEPDRLNAALAGTPLAAHGPSRTGRAPDGVDAGTDRTRIDPGTVLFEDREVAAAGLRRWLAEDVVLTPTRVMLRRPVFAEVRLQPGESDAFLVAQDRLDLYATPLVRPDRARDVEAAFRLPHQAPLLEADLAPVSERFDASLLGDDDLFLLANALPERTLFLLDAALATSTLSRPGARAPVETARAGLVPLALRGRMGAILPEAAGHALESCLAALRAVEANAQCRIDLLGMAFQLVPGLMRYVEEHALPRLGITRDPEADAAALGALVP